MASVVANSVALLNYADSVHWNGTGDWTELGNWSETPVTNGENVVWNRPGWVVGNPANTGSSTDPDWNEGFAHIDTGTVDVTPSSSPDGTVNKLYMGSDVGNTTLNISEDFTVKYKTYMGYGSTASDVATINQTAGNVSYGSDTNSRSYIEEQ